MAYQEILTSHNSIKCFWFTERIFTDADNYFEVMPDGYVELIFFFGATCALKLAANQSVPLSSPFVVGLLNNPLCFEILGHMRIYAVRLHPWCVFSFCKISGTGNDKSVLKNEVFQQLSDKLRVLYTQKEPSEVLGWFQQYFMQQVIPLLKEDSFVSAVGQSVIKQSPVPPLQKLALQHHTTLRTLQRRFLQRTGNTVKSFARKVRFEKVSHFIWFHPDCNFTSLAYEYGFADQAHFNREFKKFSGKTPGGFAKAALQAQQFFQVNNVAFLQLSNEEEK